MNQKNYKAIAKINKRNKKWFANKEVHALYCEQQADYFEREMVCSNCNEKGKVFDVHKTRPKLTCNECYGKGKTSNFNRKQFLKWCGVDNND